MHHAVFLDLKCDAERGIRRHRVNPQYPRLTFQPEHFIRLDGFGYGNHQGAFDALSQRQGLLNETVKTLAADVSRLGSNRVFASFSRNMHHPLQSGPWSTPALCFSSKYAIHGWFWLALLGF
jgi:hypothetical protein